MVIIKARNVGVEHLEALEDMSRYETNSAADNLEETLGHPRNIDPELDSDTRFQLCDGQGIIQKIECKGASNPRAENSITMDVTIHVNERVKVNIVRIGASHEQVSDEPLEVEIGLDTILLIYRTLGFRDGTANIPPHDVLRNQPPI